MNDKQKLIQEVLEEIKPSTKELPHFYATYTKPKVIEMLTLVLSKQEKEFNLGKIMKEVADTTYNEKAIRADEKQKARKEFEQIIDEVFTADTEIVENIKQILEQKEIEKKF